MTKFLCVILSAAILFSCKQRSGGSKDGGTAEKEETGKEKSEIEKKITKRNYSITAANAYNNIFLDSSVMEKFISANALNDTVTRRMRSFYNARNYQYSWFSPDGLTEQARNFWNLQSYYTGINPDTSNAFKQLRSLMDRLETEESLKVSTADKNIQQAEFLLTKHFLQYFISNYESGIIKRKELEKFVPLIKTDALLLADSLITKKHKDNKYYEDDNAAFKALKDQLQKYITIAKSGGWLAIDESVVKVKAGAGSPEIINLKKRFSATGEMAADSTPVFNAALETAVKNSQQSFGFTPDGKLSVALLKELNVPVQQRIQQLLINMDRVRWMPEAEGNLIVVNIPEFMLHVYDGKENAFAMPVVVGKEGHNTIVFKGDLNQVVFSPYWNITPNIVRDEIVPAMKRDPGYLAKHNMEITGNSGGLPVVRQLPGEENSLGKVKFLFPNSFNIYFHDTPAKSLFSKDRRAYSHGCIRLSDPVKMAQYLLRNMPEWNDQSIDAAMNAGVEKTVRLRKNVPVIITYYTAWVDDAGRLNFRDDVYGHDRDLAKKMFQ